MQSLIEEAEKEYPPARGQKPLMPLIRLKVDYSGGFSTCNPLRFGQRFVGKLANPNDIIDCLLTIYLFCLTLVTYLAFPQEEICTYSNST